MYNKVSEALSARLRAIVGESNMLTGDLIGADYAHDELPGGKPSMPELVIIPESTEQVSAVLEACSAAIVPVTVRGAGTGLVGGSVPLAGGVVLSTARLNSILGYDEETLTVTVQPGVLLSALKADAEAHDFSYTPDPGEKTATVGGNAATNAGGPSALKYGSTRSSVVGLTAVLPTGEILKLGGAVGKNSSGYNLLQLIIGSEGTLAVITELILKLIPKVKADVSFILPFADNRSCVKAASRIIRAGMNPAVLEYMDTDIVEFAGNATGSPVFPIEMDGNRVGASLFITLEGSSDDELDAKMEELAELAEELECLDILVIDSPTLKRDVWAAHDAFHTAVESAAKSSTELNMVVPVSKLAEYVDFVKQLGCDAGLGVYAYAHAGDGGLHIYVTSDEARDSFSPKAEELSAKAYARCLELGGLISSEHGIGSAKRSYLADALGEAGYALLGRIKTAFDPNCILNPGKIV